MWLMLFSRLPCRITSHRRSGPLQGRLRGAELGRGRQLCALFHAPPEKAKLQGRIAIRPCANSRALVCHCEYEPRRALIDDEFVRRRRVRRLARIGANP